MRYFLPILLLSTSIAAAEPDYNELGRKGYAAWTCAAFAREMKESEESARLFELGYKSLNEFVAARFAGKLTEENTKNVPVGILWNLIGGPSVDFNLGYIWSEIGRYTYDQVSPPPVGVPSDADKRMMATEKYTAANCSLIK